MQNDELIQSHLARNIYVFVFLLQNDEKISDFPFLRGSGGGFGNWPGKCWLPDSRALELDIIMLRTQIFPVPVPTAGASGKMSRFSDFLSSEGSAAEYGGWNRGPPLLLRMVSPLDLRSALKTYSLSSPVTIIIIK